MTCFENLVTCYYNYWSQYENEALDFDKIEEQAVQLERDVIMKEQQTLNVLKELECAKRLVEGLKLNLIPEMSSFIPSPEQGLSLCPLTPPTQMFTQLNQAKLNLNKTSIDLAAIQASVESLNTKLRRDKDVLELRRNMQLPNANLEQTLFLEQSHDTESRNQQVVNFEAEQFKKMTEASRYEVMKAMAEIERTKNCIRMAEMRLNAAKKMEEAAKAVEAIAVARRNVSSSSNYDECDGITLSFDEYKALSHKAKQGEELSKTKFVDKNPILEKFEQTEDSFSTTHVQTEDSYSATRVQRSGNTFAKFKFRNSNRNPDVLNGNGNGNEGFRSTASIGDVLSRKFVVQDDVMVGRSVENHSSERQHVSLSQMLREQSRLILHPAKGNGDGNGNVEKQYFVQRKKFGFIQVPIPMKSSKKKAQGGNHKV